MKEQLARGEEEKNDLRKIFAVPKDYLKSKIYCNTLLHICPSFFDVISYCSSKVPGSGAQCMLWLANESSTK